MHEDLRHFLVFRCEALGKVLGLALRDSQPLGIAPSAERLPESQGSGLELRDFGFRGRVLGFIETMVKGACLGIGFRCPVVGPWCQLRKESLLLMDEMSAIPLSITANMFNAGKIC